MCRQPRACNLHTLCFCLFPFLSVREEDNHCRAEPFQAGIVDNQALTQPVSSHPCSQSLVVTIRCFPHFWLLSQVLRDPIFSCLSLWKLCVFRDNLDLTIQEPRHWAANLRASGINGWGKLCHLPSVLLHTEAHPDSADKHCQSSEAG